MTNLRNLLVASALAAAAALGSTGSAGAAPANAGNITPPAAGGEAATPVHHWRQRCWPVYRWVWTHWGWRHVYVGTRCRPRYHHYHWH